MRDLKGLFLSLIILCISFVTFPVISFSYEQPVENGLAWLRAHQDPDNNTWGTDTLRETATVVEALIDLGETGAAYTGGIQFLERATPETTDYLSRKIICLAKAGSTVTADITRLAGFQKTDGGFGFKAGYPSSVIDSLLAAYALQRAGKDDREIIGRLLYYLTAHQNTDGSFGFAGDGEGSIYVTAFAVPVFTAFQPKYNLSPYITKALAYILSFKHRDGGFGEGDSSVIETALALKALAAAGGNSGDILKARQYLLSMQEPDGSWDNDACATALAIPVLEKTTVVDRPNLNIKNSLITITPANPVEGRTITISCLVENTGTQAAENIKVAFYRGNPLDPQAPGQLIDNAAIALLEPSGSTQAQTAWILDGITGAGDIYVFVDPDNAVAESDETDNIASGSFTSGSKTDLVITPADISFDNPSPLEGETFTMTAVVRNTGETDSGQVCVAFYNGNPQGSGIKIGEIQYSDIAGGSYATAYFSFTLTAGSYDVYVQADPQGLIDESSTANNTASKGITIKPIEFQGIDLSVSASGINFTPAYPRQGDMVTVTAIVRNSGDRDVRSVPVMLYDNDPANNGILLANHIFSTIMSGHEEQLTVTANFQAGDHEIYAVIDPENTLYETSKTNNTARKTVTVLPAQTIIDLAVSSDDISFDPQAPDAGQEVIIKCGIRNTGTLRLENIKVKIYEGNPDAGGTLLYPEFVLAFIEAGGTGWITIHRETGSWAGDHPLYIIVDPDNSINEADEGNNHASKTLSIAGQAGSDLALSAGNIIITPSAPVPGDIVSIACPVENRGTQFIPMAEVSFSIDGVRLGMDVIENLLPGESVSAEITWDTAGMAGPHTISVVADETNSIPETNEFNNSAEKQINISAPDLQIRSEDISFTPQTVLAGESVQIDCIIHNMGQQDAGSFNVGFYNGAPDQGGESLGTVQVAGIAASGRQTASLIWQTPAGERSYKIYVKADPGNSILEADKANNIARRTLTTATRIDIAVDASRITITPPEPSLADTITIHAVIENRGGTDAYNVEVAVYDGAPAADNSNRIGEVYTITRLYHGASEAVEKSFFLTEGTHEIYVVADPGNMITESDKTNNSAQVTATVAALQDIEVRSQDMDITPAAALPGDTLAISALVRNRGAQEYVDVTVRFFDGSPEAGGEQIGPDKTLALAAGRTVSVAADYPAIGGGSHVVYVIADPDNLVTEDDKSNNRAYKQVIIPSPEADLTINENQLTFMPLSPRAGETIKLTAKVINHGETSAGPFVVRFFDGSPGASSSVIIGQTTIPGIAAHSTADANADAVFKEGEHSVYAVIDPENTVVESNENNNEYTARISVQGLTGFYDDCGNPGLEPHMAQGTDVAITGANAGNAPASLTASTHPASVQYTYTGLNANAYYSVAVNYLQEPGGGRVQSMSADGVMIHEGLALPEGMAQYYRYDLPPEVYQDGTVTLSFNLVSGPDVLVSEIIITEKTGKKEEAVQSGSDWLKTHQSATGAWSIYTVASESAIALQGLAASGAFDSPVYTLIKQRLYDLQATNGSWENSVGTTCRAILALTAAGNNSGMEAMGNAVAWLKAQQNDNGSWGNYAFHTGMTIQALIAAGESKTSDAVQRAKQWLIDSKITYSNGTVWWGTADASQNPDLWNGYYPVLGLILSCSPDNAEEQAVIENAVLYYGKNYNPNRNILLCYYLNMLVYTGKPTATLKSQLKTNQQSDGGWVSDSLDVSPYSSAAPTAEAMMVLVKLGETRASTCISRAVMWIENNTNQWGDVPFPYDSTQVTGYTILALNSSDPVNGQEALTKALTRLVQVQNYQGLWESRLLAYSGVLCRYGYAVYALWPLGETGIDVTGKSAAMTLTKNYLLNAQESDGGWSGTKCYASNPSTVQYTSLAVLGLVSSGVSKSDSHITRGINWLVAGQDTNTGGWGTLIDTAFASSALQTAGSRPSELQKAVTWIKSRQNADGGWGITDSTVSETAWALIALGRAGDEGREAAKGIAWLLSIRNGDGGWAAMPGTPSSATEPTALAAWALAVSRFSMAIDLELFFSKPYYYPGDMVRMTVNPLNAETGIQTLEGSVKEYNGDTVPVSFIQQGTLFTGSHVLSADHLPGTDTVNIFATGDEGEGTVGGAFIVKNSSAALPDISVGPQDITCSPESPAHGDAAVIKAKITNTQVRDAVDVKVRCYDGYPGAGGAVIGETVLDRVCGLDSSTVQFNWEAVSEAHELYILLDPEGTIPETNEQNNQAYAVITVSVLSSKPDLTISAQDIVVTPATPVKGQTATLRATVYNRGGSNASDVTVQFTDGSTPIGQNRIIVSLAAGVYQTVETNWSSLTMQGRHYIHGIVDPDNSIDEANENNNEAVKVVDVGVSTLPDLAVSSSDISFSSQNPLEGDTVIISTVVRNFGEPAHGFCVGFYDGDPSNGGVLIKNEIIYETLAFGTSKVLTVQWQTAGERETHTVYVVIDPENMIAEENKTNNLASAPIRIGPSGLTVDVLSDKELYGALENAVFSVTVSNQIDEQRVVTLDFLINDSEGTAIQEVLLSDVMMLEPQSGTTREIRWNTETRRPGDYCVVAIVKENGIPRTMRRVYFSITADMNIAGEVTTDRIIYYDHEQVRITATLKSFSSNYTFKNLRSQIIVRAADGTVLHAEDTMLDMLHPLESSQHVSFWNTRRYEPGVYTILLTAFHNGREVSGDNATLNIFPGFEGAQALQGSITVTPAAVHRGQNIAVAYQAVNTGNVALPDLSLFVRILHVASQAQQELLYYPCDLGIGSTCNGTQVLTTAGMPPGEHMAVLTGIVQGITQTIAFVPFTTLNQCPVANAGNDRLTYVGQSAMVSAIESLDPDNDSLGYSWVLVEQPQGSLATLSDPNSMQCSITPDRQGDYVLELTVYDDLCVSGPDRITLSTENRPPVAEAGSDQTVHTGAAVRLDGSASSDPDGDTIAAYRWVIISNPDGSTALLSDSQAVYPIFVADRQGEYKIELVVSDGSKESESDTVIIQAENNAPVANAGSDQEVEAGAVVTLNGSASSDPDGDRLFYSWSFADTPEGSLAFFSDAQSVSPSFTADIAGTYIIRLIVRDQDAESAPDTVIINAAEQGLAGCGDIDFPDSPCSMKVDYQYEGCSTDFVKINTYQDYLNYAASNFGYGGGMYKKIKIMKDITREDGDIILHSPCEIEVKKNVSLRAPRGTIGLDGRKGVKFENNHHIESLRAACMSERGDVSVGQGSHIRAGELYLSGYGTVRLDTYALLEIAGPVSIVSTGDSPASISAITRSSTISCESLFMQGKGSVLIHEFTGINVRGPLRMISTGEQNSTEVRMKNGTAVTADSLCMEGRHDVGIGPASIIAVSGEMSIISNGRDSTGRASVKSGTGVMAGSFTLSGYKALIDPYSFLFITNNFHMEAFDSDECSVKGLYLAETTSGNCLE